LLWQDTKPRQEFIMVIDADSILRMPFIPERLGVAHGALCSAGRLFSQGVAAPAGSV
jgi:hypothetical protein